MNPTSDIKSINYEKINSYIQTLKNKNNSNNTINAKAAYLSKLLKYAYDNRLIDYKPPIPFYKIKKHKTLYLTKADMKDGKIRFKRPTKNYFNRLLYRVKNK